ncbi:MAG: hypothetical protein Q8L48_34280 [Archangium sp.]|nr:hypothetical protein [Archangium sp.]
MHADQLIERGYRRVLVEELPSVLSQLAPWVTWHAQPASLDTWWSAWGAPRREVLWLVQELASASCSATELRLESHRGAIVTVGQPVAPAQLERFPAAIRPFLATHSTIEASESGFSAGLDINLDEDDFIAQASESGFDDLFPFIRRDETTYGVARTGEVLELSPANEGPAPHIVGDVGALVMHQLMQALFPDGRNEELHALRARLARARALT